MKNYAKRFVLLLALLLCAALLGGAALADEETPRSGAFYNGVEWALDDAGTLTFTGTGEIPYSAGSTWKALRDEIKKAVFSEGLTSIGSDTLVECHNLETVELPSTLTAFNYLALRDTPALQEVNVAPGCEKYFSHEGVLYENRYDGKVWLMYYPAGKAGAYAVPDNVDWISGSFQDNTNLTEITLPASLGGDRGWVSEYGSARFSGCTALKKITISEGATKLGKLAENCPALESIVLPFSLTGFSADIAADCPALKEVTFAGAPLSAPISGPTYFDAAAEGFTLRVPNAWLELWQESAWNKYPIEGYELPRVKLQEGTWGDGDENSALLTWEYFNDGSLVFSGSGAMKSAFVTSNRGWHPFAASILEVTLGEGITNVGDYCFSECSRLRRVHLPESLTAVGEKAFYKCGNLREVLLPDAVTSIGRDAFYMCYKLETLRLGYQIDKFPSYYTDWFPAPENAPNLTLVGYEHSRAQLFAEKYGYGWRSEGPCPIEEVRVTTEEELLAALGSHRRILVADGVYLFPSAVQLDKYLELSLVAEHPGKAELLCESGYSVVVSAGMYNFSNEVNYVCGWIGLEGLILGHTVTPTTVGGCGGGGAHVVQGTTVRELSIKNCDLWGCGVIAVYLSDCTGVTVEDSILRDCTERAVSAYNSELSVKSCVISGNDYRWLNSSKGCVSLSGEGTTSFTDCLFINNHNKVFLENGTAASEEEIFVNCTYFDNLWQEGVTQNKNYGVCLGGVTWQLRLASPGKFRLILGEDILAEDGSLIAHSAEGEIPSYSEYSLPWKKWLNQLVSDVPGDVNGDGAVDTADAAAIFGYASGAAAEIDETAADVNGDGKINNRDALLLFRRAAGAA